VGPDTTIPVIDTRCDGPPDEPDSGIIDGQICNRHTGELVSAATVNVIAANNDVIGTAESDSLGNFVIQDVPEGDHVVSIRAPNFSRSFPVTVVVGETTTLDLSAGGCEIPTTIGGAIVGSLCDPPTTSSMSQTLPANSTSQHFCPAATTSPSPPSPPA
jgi:hypothetical protein